MTCLDAMRRSVYVALAAGLGMTTACTGGAADGGQLERAAAQPLRNGSTQTQRQKGLVDLTSAYDTKPPANGQPGYGFHCSGVMLNPTSILTSARCARRVMRPGLTLETTAAFLPDLYEWQYDAGSGTGRYLKHCVWDDARACADGDVNLYSTFSAELETGPKVERLEVYSMVASPDKDLAILYTGTFYPGKSTLNDYADIYMDDFTAASMPRLQFYGWGKTGPNDPYPLSEPRKGTMQVLNVTPSRIDLRPDQIQACSGDEGGAWTIPDGNPSANGVVAIESSFTPDPTTGCSQSGSTDRATRISDKMSWIESVIGPCSNFTDGGGHNIKRCYSMNCDGAPDGTTGAWDGCRGSGCAVCDELISSYPKYFEHHRNCSRNTTCDGDFYRCSAECPAPTDADR